MSISEYNNNNSNSTNRLLFLFNNYSNNDYIGEPVSILQHSLLAAYLANQRTNDIDIIIACLLHDIGHLIGLEAILPSNEQMEGCGTLNHEKVASEFLKSLGFSDRICLLVESHVSAKRYLCYRDSNYYNRLSDASKTTLRYQGGLMNEDEAKLFESSPDFNNFLLMRQIDELSKDPSIKVNDLSYYLPILNSLTNNFTYQRDYLVMQNLPTYLLSHQQVNSYKANSYIKINNLLSYYNINNSLLTDWIDDISNWPKESNKWLIHYELTSNNQKILCRIENFVKFHKDLDSFINKQVVNIVSQLFNDYAILFKEKINFKLPGGAGFAAHQDTPAYINMGTSHVTAMIAIDPCTIANGCLYVSPGDYLNYNPSITLDKSGILTKECEEKLSFEPVECLPGDFIFFNGYIPHKSYSNATNTSRRAIFLTFNLLKEGDFHEDYYNAKFNSYNNFNSNKSISFQGDFQGVIVD